MTPTKTLLRTLALSMLALVGAAASAAEPWEADLSHTRISFEVEHLGFSIMPGIFRDFEVDFQFDPEAPEDSSLAVVIRAESIDMFHDGLNEHLRNEDFFDVAAHPEITFTSTEVVPTGDDTARVTGDLTMLGVSQPVSFDVTLRKLGPHPFNQQPRAGFSATGVVDRTAFGMDYAAPVVGTDIAFTLAAEFAPAEDPEPRRQPR